MSDVSHDPGEAIHPLLQVMRTYAFAYTANHDFGVCPSIMVEDYELRMGQHRIVGRDSAYRAATQRQFDQFPGLGFTVHDVVTNGHRVALRFSEHGRSLYRNAVGVWGGVSLYQWDGTRLTSCIVEQDYFARRRQLDAGVPNPLESPALDPWVVSIEPSSLEAEGTLRKWVLDGGIDQSNIGSLDDEWSAPAARNSFKVRETVFDDLFSAGSRVAFHVTQLGDFVSDDQDETENTPMTLTRHAAGIADVESGSVNARVITDRVEIERQLDSQRPPN